VVSFTLPSLYARETSLIPNELGAGGDLEPVWTNRRGEKSVFPRATPLPPHASHPPKKPRKANRNEEKLDVMKSLEKLECIGNIYDDLGLVFMPDNTHNS